MKIIFIIPKQKTDNKTWNKFSSIWSQKMIGKKMIINSPAAYGILASMTSRTMEVKVIDDEFEKIDFEEKCDVVCMGFATAQAVRAYEIADNFRKMNRKVILGGIHVSVLPDEAIYHCDSVVIGEAENVWQEILKDIANNNLNKKYEGGICKDINSIPIQRFAIFDTMRYGSHAIQTTRGCPFKCEFCSVHKFSGNKYRMKDIQRITDEVRVALSIHDKPIFFTDDNFTHNTERTKILLKELIPLRIPGYTIQTRLDVYKDLELMDLLYKSGCNSILIGFESLNQDALNKMNKKNNSDDYYKAIEIIQDKGIAVRGSFILGNDDDDQYIFEQVANFVYNSNMLCPLFHILTPCPGTDLFKRLESENRILNMDWSLYDGCHVCFKPNRMSVNDLEAGFMWLFKEVFDPKKFLNRFDNVIKIWNMKKIGYRYRMDIIAENLHCYYYSFPKEELFAD